MTVQSKTTIKSYFETGDKPTAAQFIDLVDSYFNADAVSTLGAAIVSASTTAAVQSMLSLSYATTAQATAGTAANVVMDPVMVKNAISSQSSSELVLLGTATAAASSTLDFTSMLGSGYSKYVLVFKDLLPSAAASVGLKISTDNGSTWAQQLNSQLWSVSIGNTSAVGITATSNTTPAAISTAIQAAFNGEANFTVNSTLGILWEGMLIAGTPGNIPYKSFLAMGNSASAAIVNAIRLLPSSGNFTSGSVYLYGVKNT